MSNNRIKKIEDDITDLSNNRIKKTEDDVTDLSLQMMVSRTPGRKRRTASSVALTARVVLVAASLVGSAQSWRFCTSDDECKYQGCPDGYCSTLWAECYGIFSNQNHPHCPDPPPCPTGTYSADGLNGGGVKACSSCDAGKYASTAGLSPCVCARAHVRV